MDTFRKILRYTIAAILTSLIVGTSYYWYYQFKIKYYQVDVWKEYIYRSTWLECCGTSLSMLIPVALLYALAKLFILKRNENYWLNFLLIFFIAILFFGTLFSLTWGIGFKDDISLFQVILVISPYLLFPLFLILAGRFIHNSHQQTSQLLNK